MAARRGAGDVRTKWGPERWGASRVRGEGRWENAPWISGDGGTAVGGVLGDRVSAVKRGGARAATRCVGNGVGGGGGKWRRGGRQHGFR